MELEGKVALVTGSSRGMGAATAKLLASNGVAVGINYLSRSDLAEQVIGEIHAMGGKAVAIRADVSRRKEAYELVKEVVESLGRLDILVNNAGGPAPGSIQEVSEETWHKAIALHLDGPFYCTRAALPYLKRSGGGAIINLASVAALRGIHGAVAYQTVKGAILTFTMSLALELAPFHIRVNCVSPGVIRTDFHSSMTPERKSWNEKYRIPLHREGRPEEVANAILFLIKNDYITGENVVIDGGLSKWMADIVPRSWDL